MSKIKRFDKEYQTQWTLEYLYLQEKFLYAISRIDSEEIQAALVDSFNNILSVEELQNLLTQLTTAEGFDSKYPLIVYLQAKLDTRKELVSNVEAILQDEYKAMADSLSEADLKIAANFGIDNDTLSWDELIDKIKEVKEKTK